MALRRPLNELATAEEWAAVDPRYTSPETSRPFTPPCAVCGTGMESHRRCRRCRLLLGPGHHGGDGVGRVCDVCRRELGR